MSTPIVQLEDFKKTYQSGDIQVHAVRGVNLTVQAGEFIAVMGASGSGKSTLMNTVGCLDRPSGGRFMLDGVDVSKLNRDELADLRNQKIGFVFQGFNLLARTSALENCELPMLYARPSKSAPAQRERAMKSLERVGLGKRFDHTPNQLSGGQQQRVAIARAIVTKPGLILADEPTGNLDSARGREIMELLTQLNREEGLSVLMVTHEPDMADYASRVVTFIDGRIQSDVRKAVQRAG